MDVDCAIVVDCGQCIAACVGGCKLGDTVKLIGRSEAIRSAIGGCICPNVDRCRGAVSDTGGSIAAGVGPGILADCEIGKSSCRCGIRGRDCDWPNVDRAEIVERRNGIAATDRICRLGDARIDLREGFGIGGADGDRDGADIDRRPQTVGDFGRSGRPQIAICDLVDAVIIICGRARAGTRSEGVGADRDHAVIIEPRRGKEGVGRRLLRDARLQPSERIGPGGRQCRCIGIDDQRPIIRNIGNRASAIGVNILPDAVIIIGIGRSICS